MELIDEVNMFKLFVVLLTELLNELNEAVKALNDDVVPNPNEVIGLFFHCVEL
jgi:hypothetical protein